MSTLRELSARSPQHNLTNSQECKKLSARQRVILPPLLKKTYLTEKDIISGPEKVFGDPFGRGQAYLSERAVDKSLYIGADRRLFTRGSLRRYFGAARWRFPSDIPFKQRNAKRTGHVRLHCSSACKAEEICNSLR